MSKHYPILRFIGALYQALAVLTLIGAVIAAVTGTRYGIVISLLVGVVIAVSLFAIGESIFVFLGIEENTRRQADAMERWGGGPPP